MSQGYGHSGTFALNVDETLGVSTDEDLVEAMSEAEEDERLRGQVASFEGVLLPEWTEDIYDGLAGEWSVIEVWRRCVALEENSLYRGMTSIGSNPD